jgi:hypothetical protein
MLGKPTAAFGAMLAVQARTPHQIIGQSDGLPRCQYQAALTATRIMQVPVRKNNGEINGLLIVNSPQEMEFRTWSGVDEPLVAHQVRLGAEKTVYSCCLDRNCEVEQFLGLRRRARSRDCAETEWLNSGVVIAPKDGRLRQEDEETEGKRGNRTAEMGTGSADGDAEEQR